MNNIKWACIWHYSICSLDKAVWWNLISIRMKTRAFIILLSEPFCAAPKRRWQRKLVFIITCWTTSLVAKCECVNERSRKRVVDNSSPLFSSIHDYRMYIIMMGALNKFIKCKFYLFIIIIIANGSWWCARVWSDKTIPNNKRKINLKVSSGSHSSLFIGVCFFHWLMCFYLGTKLRYINTSRWHELYCCWQRLLIVHPRHAQLITWCSFVKINAYNIMSCFFCQNICHATSANERICLTRDFSRTHTKKNNALDCSQCVNNANR